MNNLCDLDTIKRDLSAFESQMWNESPAALEFYVTVADVSNLILELEQQRAERDEDVRVFKEVSDGLVELKDDHPAAQYCRNLILTRLPMEKARE